MGIKRVSRWVDRNDLRLVSIAVGVTVGGILLFGVSGLLGGLVFHSSSVFNFPLPLTITFWTGVGMAALVPTFFIIGNICLPLVYRVFQRVQ